MDYHRLCQESFALSFRGRCSCACFPHAWIVQFRHVQLICRLMQAFGGLTLRLRIRASGSGGRYSFLAASRAERAGGRKLHRALPTSGRKMQEGGRPCPQLQAANPGCAHRGAPSNNGELSEHTYRQSCDAGAARSIPLKAGWGFSVARK